MLLRLWDAFVHIGIPFYTLCVLGLLICLGIKKKIAYISWGALIVGGVVIKFKETTLEGRIILLLPFIIFLMLLIPDLFIILYKRFVLKTMDKVIIRYEKKYGLTSSDKFRNYVNNKYPKRSYFEYTKAEYYKFMNIPNVKGSSLINSSSLSILWKPKLYYLQLIIIKYIIYSRNRYREHVGSILMERLKKSNYRITRNQIIDELNKYGFQDYISDEDGIILIYESVDYMLNYIKELGVIYEYTTNNGQKAYSIGKQLQDVTDYGMDEEWSID